ncbi:hypothetical protein CBR_g3867 [Chara braunii]|uniref:Uncharacterized protein n=1 Tax=Chara braunii TaxID=69332 RepID=A0A388KGP2_CHABU|nr:hypothetical protein CBR_g3867 [Chara braunii]|eukprot:GBG69167.1 hypothetical protein CBR_g3867 [Chara braunii]
MAHLLKVRRSTVHLAVVFCQFSLFLSVMVAKPHVRIPDNLEDVVDDEEDEEWRRWGRFKSYPPKNDPDTLVDFSGMGANEVVRSSRPRGAICFAKLREGAFATKEETRAAGTRWSDVMLSGGLYHKSYVVDENTVAFTPEDTDMVDEMKRFLLLQPEISEFQYDGKKYYPDPRVYDERESRQRREEL